MLIEQPPQLIRLLYPSALWRMDKKEKSVYLTFDDGPIPEITPWVLDLLDKYHIKATFFMVGDNVRKHPKEYEMVVKEDIESVIIPSTIYAGSNISVKTIWLIQIRLMNICIRIYSALHTDICGGFSIWY